MSTIIKCLKYTLLLGIVTGLFVGNIHPQYVFAEDEGAPSGPCSVESVQITPSTPQKISANIVNTSWGVGQSVSLGIQTKNCKDKEINVSLRSNRLFQSTSGDYRNFNVADLDNKSYTVGDGDVLLLQMTNGEEFCNRIAAETADGLSLAAWSAQHLATGLNQLTDNNTSGYNKLSRDEVVGTLKKIYPSFSEQEIIYRMQVQASIIHDHWPKYSEDESDGDSIYANIIENYDAFISEYLEDYYDGLDDTPPGGGIDAHPNNSEFNKHIAQILNSMIMEADNQSERGRNPLYQYSQCDYTAIAYPKEKNGVTNPAKEESKRFQYQCEDNVSGAVEAGTEIGIIDVIAAASTAGLSLEANILFNAITGGMYDCWDGIGATSITGQIPWKVNNVTTVSGFLSPNSVCLDENGQERPGNCQELLAPLPGFGAYVDDTLTIGKWINTMLKIILGIMGVVAFFKLFYCGIMYLLTPIVSKKISLKDCITNSFIGIAICAGCFVILSTINPYLLDLNPNVQQAMVDIGIGAAEDNNGITVQGGAGKPPKNDTKLQQWIRENGAILKIKKADGTYVDIKPCDESTFVSVKAFGGTYRLHKEAAPHLEAVSKAWEAKGGSSFYKIPASEEDRKAMGGYNCRLIRNTTDQVSPHAYGIVFDLNPTLNPFLKFVEKLPSDGKVRTIGGIMTKYSQPSLWVLLKDKTAFLSNRSNYTDMPAEFVKMWTDNGWGWGGDWNQKYNAKDAMHFSLLEREGGTLVSPK